MYIILQRVDYNDTSNRKAKSEARIFYQIGNFHVVQFFNIGRLQFISHHVHYPHSWHKSSKIKKGVNIGFHENTTEQSHTQKYGCEILWLQRKAWENRNRRKNELEKQWFQKNKYH